MDELTIPVTKDMLDRAVAFAIDYNLEDNKMEQGRTVGESRALGGLFDAFVPGKIIELAVEEIINKNATGKTCYADLVVREKQDFSEPDIPNVKEEGSSDTRKAKVLVETKNSADNYRWVGVSESQFKTLRAGQPDLDKIYIVVCSIGTHETDDETPKHVDLLGTYLSSQHSKSEKFSSYKDVAKYYVHVDYVLTGTELDDNARLFQAGMIFPDNKILFESPMDLINKDGSLRRNFEELSVVNGREQLPTDRIPWIDQFREAFCDGSYTVFLKTGQRLGEEMTPSIYLKADGDIVLVNDFLGRRTYSAGLYCLKVRSVTGRPKSDSDWWVSKENIHSIIGATTIERVKEIAKKI